MEARATCMGREEGEGRPIRKDGWIRFGRIAKRWVSEAYKMQHGSPRTENAGEYSWMSCQYNTCSGIVTALSQDKSRTW